MRWLIYELQDIPDLSLAKYQSLENGRVDGVLELHVAFLRQWHKISSMYHVGIHYIVKYEQKNDRDNHFRIFLGFSYDNADIEGQLYALFQASSLKNFYTFQQVNGLDEFVERYAMQVSLKKCERKRTCEKNEYGENIPLFFAETWKSNKNARLYDLFSIMQALDTNAMYCVSLFGIDNFEVVYQSLEKPIAYLRNKTSHHDKSEIKLNKDNGGHLVYKRDIVAEETLKKYEDFIKIVSESVCYQANVSVYAKKQIDANIILNTACGEVIEEGNWEISRLEGSLFEGKFNKMNNMMPETLSYWPTYYTLDEVSPFLRLPVLYEGENLNIRKETEPHNYDGELDLGVNSSKKKVNVPLNLLKKHAFICGVPGAGKTNTMLHLCYELWKTHHIPFLVMEPAKKEYRALAQTDIDELLVFSPASGSKFPLAINPFEFAKGLSLSEHIQNLMDVFEGAFPLSPPLPALLDRAIEGVYEKYGWDSDDVNDGSKEYPTMIELYESLKYELEQTDYDGEVRGNMKSALEMRIGGLLKRDLGNVFNVKVSTLSPEEIVEKPIIIEMESLGSGPSNFLNLMLCTLIREVLRANPFANPEKDIRHIIFIEEAHNLIAAQTGEVSADEANPKVAATNYIVKMLAEVRALKEGIVIADQLPTAMAPEVLKNTGLKIVHRLTAEDDRVFVGSTMSANNVQLDELATFLPGNALLSYEGLLRPFKMQIKNFVWKDTPTDERLYELMSVKQEQRVVSKRTISIRLERIKAKWIYEWDVAMVVFKRLEVDCKELEMKPRSEKLADLVNSIVREQVGLEDCISKLKKVKYKYMNTLGLAMEKEQDDLDFYSSIEKGIDMLTKSAYSLLTKIKF